MSQVCFMLHILAEYGFPDPHPARPTFHLLFPQELLSALALHDFYLFKMGGPREQCNVMWAIAKGGEKVMLPEKVKLADWLKV